MKAVLEDYFGTELTTEDIKAFQTRILHGGEWLFQQDEDGDSLYLLARGRLQAWRKSTAGSEPLLLGEITPGDSVGEMSLLGNQPRSAAIRAVRDSLLVQIDRPHFDALAASHPSLVTRLAANVVNMTRQTETKGARFRPPRTVAVVSLDGSPESLEFGRSLATEAAKRVHTAQLDRETANAQVSGSGSEDLRDWIHEQEDAHELVLFQYAPGDPPWNQLVRRQADLILFVAHHSSEPDERIRELVEADYGAQHALVLLHSDAHRPITGTAAWLDACPVDFHLHVHAGHDEDLARVARVITGNAVGLVLSAGAARGFAHIGVYRAMQELGIPVDWIGGSSIGSIMGAAMASGWDMDHIIETSRQCFVKGKPFSDYTVPVTSLIRGQRMTKLLNEHLDFQIEDLPIPFFCVSSVLDDGGMNVHRRGSLARALCASAALPGVIPPAVIERRLAIDGSVLNSLPVDLMQKMPVGKIVAVDLSSQKTYQVDYDQMPSGWRVLAGRYLPFFKRHRVPPLATIMLKATEIGTLGRMRELGKRADILLQPDVRGFGITQVKTFDQIVEAGYDCAVKGLEDWAPPRQTA